MVSVWFLNIFCSFECKNFKSNNSVVDGVKSSRTRFKTYTQCLSLRRLDWKSICSFSFLNIQNFCALMINHSENANRKCLRELPKQRKWFDYERNNWKKKFLNFFFFKVEFHNLKGRFLFKFCSNIFPLFNYDTILQFNLNISIQVTFHLMTAFKIK